MVISSTTETELLTGIREKYGSKNLQGTKLWFGSQLLNPRRNAVTKVSDANRICTYYSE
jgi:hypothetical protein